MISFVIDLLLMFLKITHLHTEAVFVCARSLQPCWALCDPMDCSPPGFSVHGILQARTLEQVAMPSSRGSSWPRNWTLVFLCLLHLQKGSLPLVPPGKTIQRLYFLKWWKITLVYFPMNLSQIMAYTMCFLVLYISAYIDMETQLTLQYTKHTILYYTYFCI